MTVIDSLDNGVVSAELGSARCRIAAPLDTERSELWPALVFPLDRTVAVLEIADRRCSLDGSAIAVVPGGARHTLRAVPGGDARAIMLWIGPRALELALSDGDLRATDARRVERELRRPQVLRRTAWMEGLVRRYVTARDGALPSSATIRFLTAEILRELVAALDAMGRILPAPAPAARELVERCRALVDERLFEHVDIEALARGCRTSESTLHRAFKRELGMAPMTYVRTRRLEEARRLLQSGRYRVGEVAALLGYAGAAAFSTAFARQFGEPPSRLRSA